jgi:hypothetical protein
MVGRSLFVSKAAHASAAMEIWLTHVTTSTFSLNQTAKRLAPRPSLHHLISSLATNDG